MSPITRAQKKKKKTNQESSSSSLILSLPEDLLIHCIARVQKQNYQNLSRVCKLFRSIITSPDLFAKRSLLKCTESCIYVPIRDCCNDYIHWYTLIRNENGDKKLVRITSLPPMPDCKGYVSFGYKIFVIGGYYNSKWKSDSSVIDCRFDVARSIGSMPELVSNPIVSDVVDGKIYVIGGDYSKNRKRKTGKPMLVLDTETETWEYDTKSGLADDRWVIKSVTMDGKIYVKGAEKNFVFDPKESKWEVLLAENEEEETFRSVLGWGKGCVINEMLYVLDFRNDFLIAYDLKKMLYHGVVEGVEGLGKYGQSGWTVCCCGEKKMMLLLLLESEKGDLSRNSYKIWCAEIVLMEKNERGEIWGNVEWCQLVLEGDDVVFTDCVTVTV